MEITPTRFSAVPLPASTDAGDVKNREIARATRSLNEEGVAGSDRQFSFSVDPKTKQAVVRIVDLNTGELLDQIPSVYLLEVARQLEELRSTNPQKDR